MTISSSDINFYYSGGINNIDPTVSIGGKASLNLIQGVANNLFDDNSVVELSTQTDYRCFYIFNTSELYSLYDANIYVLSQSGSLSNVTLGISNSTDVQSLNIDVTTPASGNFKLKYDDLVTDAIIYDDNPNVLENNIQAELNKLGSFSGITVNSTGAENDFLISFSGNEDNRNHSLLTSLDVNMSPAATITISKVTEGQPVNSEAPLLPTAQTTPFGVVFSATSPASRISIGDLRPGDGVPIWIKRTIAGTTSASQLNDFELRLSGQSVES